MGEKHLNRYPEKIGVESWKLCLTKETCGKQFGPLRSEAAVPVALTNHTVPADHAAATLLKVKLVRLQVPAVPQESQVVNWCP